MIPFASILFLFSFQNVFPSKCLVSAAEVPDDSTDLLELQEQVKTLRAELSEEKRIRDEITNVLISKRVDQKYCFDLCI